MTCEHFTRIREETAKNGGTLMQKKAVNRGTANAKGNIIEPAKSPQPI